MNWSAFATRATHCIEVRFAHPQPSNLSKQGRAIVWLCESVTSNLFHALSFRDLLPSGQPEYLPLRLMAIIVIIPSRLTHRPGRNYEHACLVTDLEAKQTFWIFGRLERPLFHELVVMVQTDGALEVRVLEFFSAMYDNQHPVVTAGLRHELRKMMNGSYCNSAFKS